MFLYSKQGSTCSSQIDADSFHCNRSHVWTHLNFSFTAPPDNSKTFHISNTEMAYYLKQPLPLTLNYNACVIQWKFTFSAIIQSIDATYFCLIQNTIWSKNSFDLLKIVTNLNLRRHPMMRRYKYWITFQQKGLYIRVCTCMKA